jgi:hypothetical protein
MVALSKNSATFPQRPLRVRAQDHRYRLGAAHCSKSNNQGILRQATYVECDRLESCSKDPIGYEGGQLVYGEYFSLAKLDPMGTLTIEPLPSSSLWSPFHECRKDSEQQWRFRLSKQAKQLCNGTGGFIVQKVNASCSGETCPDDKKCDSSANAMSAEFWEAWYVGPDDDLPSGLFAGRITDGSSWSAPRGTCGSRRADGEVRFYCSELTDEDMRQFPPVILPFCGGVITSDQLPGWAGAPHPWMTKKSDDGVAKRWHKRDWNCCADVLVLVTQPTRTPNGRISVPQCSISDRVLSNHQRRFS